MDRYDPYTDKFIGETIDRAVAIDALRDYLVGKSCPDDGTLTCRLIENEVINKLPSAQPYTIHSDGRLWITVDDIDKVTAVVVNEHKSKFCKQFYEDYEDAQPETIYCKDCKHWITYDWMFSEVWQSKNMADYPEDEIGCNYCDMTMKANDFCSRGERREVTT